MGRIDVDRMDLIKWPVSEKLHGLWKITWKTQKSHEQWEFMAFLKVIMMIISMCKMYLRIYGRWQQALVGQVSWLEGCEVELRRFEARRLLPGSRLPFSPCCRLAGALRFVYPVPMAGKPGTGTHFQSPMVFGCGCWFAQVSSSDGPPRPVHQRSYLVRGHSHSSTLGAWESSRV